MNEITVAVLTVSDRCFKGEAVDESGSKLVDMINNGLIKNAKVVKTQTVADSERDIYQALKSWSDEEICMILTTGGTGLAERDVTPEVTATLLEKTLPGIQHMMFRRGLDVTPLSALSRAVAGVRKKSLIINLPGSKKASSECLEAIEGVISHAIDLIRGQEKNVREVHNALEKRTSQVGNLSNRPRMSPYVCVEVPNAQKIILGKAACLQRGELMSYEDALDHVLAEDIYAVDDLPRFDCSLRDGYAVMVSDGISTRTVIGASCAGDKFNELPYLSPGSCVRINTGAIIPRGADAVVQVEDTQIVEFENKEELRVIVKKLPLPGQNIRPRGFDFKAGQLILSCGTHLRPAALGLLGAVGRTSVRVLRKPVVGIFSTGDELVDPGDLTEPHQVRDSNRIALKSLLVEENFPAVDLGIVKDHPDELLNSLEKGFRSADVVVTTGSMSMGNTDYLKEVLITDFNAKILFGRVWLQPGMPTACAEVVFEGKEKLWIGLPGNPASALVTAQLFVLPTLRAISGREKILPLEIQVKLDRKIDGDKRPQYVRAELSHLDGEWFARVTGNQSSSRIGSCVNSSCLVIIPQTSSSSSSLELSSKPKGLLKINDDVKHRALLFDRILI